MYADRECAANVRSRRLRWRRCNAHCRLRGVRSRSAEQRDREQRAAHELSQRSRRALRRESSPVLSVRIGHRCQLVAAGRCAIRDTGTGFEIGFGQCVVLLARRLHLRPLSVGDAFALRESLGLAPKNASLVCARPMWTLMSDLSFASTVITRTMPGTRCTTRSLARRCRVRSATRARLFLAANCSSPFLARGPLAELRNACAMGAGFCPQVMGRLRIARARFRWRTPPCNAEAVAHLKPQHPTFVAEMRLSERGRAMTRTPQGSRDSAAQPGAVLA